MTIIRTSHNKDNPYVILNKSALEDSNLSWNAKGLWAYLMSRPDDWKILVSHLSKIYPKKGGGEKAIYKILNELIDNGYCTFIQEKDENGKFKPVEYIITEFKKYLPHSPQGDAVERDAVQVAHTNKGSLPSKKLQQEAAAVSSEDQRLHELLAKQGLSETTTLLIKEKYSSSEITRALAWLTHPKTKVKTTKEQALLWACKNQPDLPAESEDNRTLMEKFVKQNQPFPSHIMIDFYQKNAEITIAGHHHAYIFEYSKDNDLELFKHQIVKLRKPPKLQNVNNQ